MARGVLERTVIDNFGNAIVGADVTVKLAGTETLASLYDAQVGGSALPNPSATVARGLFQVYVENGEYDLVIDTPGTDLTLTDVRVFDAEDLAAQVNADAVATAADRVQTGIDAAATAADAIATAADRVQTGLDATATAADAIATAADAVSTGGDATATAADAIATAADRVQTGLDATATAADAIATAADAVATGDDAAATAADAIATAADAVSTSDDATATAADAVATAADAVSTAADAVAASDSADSAAASAASAAQSYTGIYADKAGFNTALAGLADGRYKIAQDESLAFTLGGTTYNPPSVYTVVSNVATLEEELPDGESLNGVISPRVVVENNLATIRQKPDYALDPEGAEFIPPSKLDVTRATVVVFDKDGTARQAPADSLDLTYDENGIASFPVYAEHTQKLLYNQDFSDASWLSFTTPTKSQNATDILGNANTAWTLTDGDAVNSASVYKDTAGATNGSKAVVVVCIGYDPAPTAHASATLQFRGGTTVLTGAIHIDTSTGEIVDSSGNLDSFGAIPVKNSDGDRFWLVHLSNTNNSSGNDTVRAFFGPAVGTVLGTADVAATGSAVFDVPCLFLDTSIPYPPIVTTTAAVTRAVDDAPILLPRVFEKGDQILIRGEMFAGNTANKFLIAIRDLSVTDTITSLLVFSTSPTDIRLSSFDTGTAIAAAPTTSLYTHGSDLTDFRYSVLFVHEDGKYRFFFWSDATGYQLLEHTESDIPAAMDAVQLFMNGSAVGDGGLFREARIYNAGALTDAQRQALVTEPTEV